jgi:hypothetical protein
MNITQIIGINLLTIITFICGYTLGYIINEQKHKENIWKNLKNVVIRKVDDITGKGEIGVVERPTQKEILKREHPYYKKVEAGLNEMRKLIKNIKGKNG